MGYHLPVSEQVLHLLRQIELANVALLFTDRKAYSLENKRTHYFWKNMSDEKHQFILTDITGKNQGLLSEWFVPSQVNKLADIAETGDRIEVQRVGYSHWGTYWGLRQSGIGKGEGCIVHLGLGDSRPLSEDRNHTLSKPAINYSGLPEVAKISKVRISNIRDLVFGMQPTKNVELIRMRIKEFESMKMPYQILNHNCEDFANYCRYGKTGSNQEEFFVAILSVIPARQILSELPFDAKVSQVITVACLVVLIMLTLLVAVGCLATVSESLYFKIALKHRSNVDMNAVVLGKRKPADKTKTPAKFVRVLFLVMSTLGLKYSIFAIFLLAYSYVSRVKIIKCAMMAETEVISVFGTTHAIYVTGLLTVVYIAGLKYLPAVMVSPKFVLYKSRLIITCFIIGTNIANFIFRPTYLPYVAGLLTILGVKFLKSKVAPTFKYDWAGLPIAFFVVTSNLPLYSLPIFLMYIVVLMIGISYVTSGVEPTSALETFRQAVIYIDRTLFGCCVLVTPTYLFYGIIILRVQWWVIVDVLARTKRGQKNES